MRRIGMALSVVALLAAGPAYATNGMRMIGFGPVQGSMGGVGVGLTLDGNALVSNPAGITELGHRVDVAIGYFVPTVRHEATGTPTGAPPPNPPSMIAADGQSVTSDRGGSPIPAIAYVRPLGGGFSAGVGLFAVSGMGVDYPVNIYLSPAKTSYLNARLAPGVAYRVSETLSLGVAANVMMAQMEFDVAGAIPPGMGGQVEHGPATSWGYGATLGLKITPAPWLALGAAYETRSTFQDFEFDVPGGTDALTFHQPQVGTVGFSIRPSERLVIAADVQWIDWSSTMGANLPRYSESQPTTMPFDMGWKDQWVFKVGAQFTPVHGLDLRVGYNHGDMPLDPSRAFENLVFPAVSEDHVTAGLGWAVTEKITLHLSGMYSFKAELSGSNSGPPPGQMIDSYSTSMSQLQVDAGVSFRL